MSEGEESGTEGRGRERGAEERAFFFVVKVPAGQEAGIIKLLAKKAEYSRLGVRSILFVPRLRGYLFLEADREYEVRKLVRGVSRAKMLPGSPVPLSEIDALLYREPEKIEIEPGDIVQIIRGNFKGFRALVLSSPSGKGRKLITARLLDIERDWEVQLPVDSVKLVEKGKEEGEEAPPEEQETGWTEEV